MKILIYTLSSTVLVVLLMVTAALVWGGPGTPAPLASINDPFIITYRYKDAALVED